MQVNMHEAKTQLSKLVEAALRGEEVLIANRGKPVVKVIRADAKPKRRWGAWEGRLTSAISVWELMSKSTAATWRYPTRI
jgi:prevent-host-death family protein